MQAVEKITYSNDWVTLVYFTLFVGVFLLQLIDKKKLKKFFLTSNIIENEDIENASFYDVSKIIIFLFSTTILSLLAYKFKIYKQPTNNIDFVSFLYVLISLSFYFVIKRILEYLLVLLFMIKSDVHFFIYLKNNYLYSISFLLYVALILSEYTDLDITYLFFFAIFLFTMRFVFLVIRNKKLIFNKLFYFILYICALEIAPLFVLFKLMF